jgi:hypothetical protein
MENKCEHKNKAYSLNGYSLTCNPPINVSPWICKDCGFESEDKTQTFIRDEYGETKRKFRNYSTITITPTPDELGGKHE